MIYCQYSQFVLVQQSVTFEHFTTVSLEPNGVHPQVMRDLAEMTTKPLSIMFERFLGAGSSFTPHLLYLSG